MYRIKTEADQTNFISKQDLDSKEISIYRITNFNRFRCDFEGKSTNSLSNPKNWKLNLNGDKYENILLEANYELKYPGGQQTGLDFAKDIYCQSWSSSKNSDALWQIYSCSPENLHEKNTIVEKNVALQIKTSPEKLINSLVKSFGDEGNDRAYVGIVNYIEKSSFQFMANELASSIKALPNTKSFMKTLFYKKKSYEHEKEIRLGYMSAETDLIIKAENGKQFYEYELDYLELIDEIIVDPRLNSKEFEAIKEKLVKLGFFRWKIIKSDAYEGKQMTGYIT